MLTKAELLQIIRLVEQGKITPVVTKTYPFEQANKALNDLKEQKSLGRTVLLLQKVPHSWCSAQKDSR